MSSPGRNAVVTGAGRGIGAAVARSLARSGYGLGLIDACEDDPLLSYSLASREELEAVAAECRQLGAAGALVFATDVRDRPGLVEAAAETAEELGGLDGAVAAAGIIGGGEPSWETDPALFELMLSVNLMGVFNLVRAATPHLLARPAPRSGRIVAVASAGASVGLPRLSGYVAAKHGVAGLIRSLAAELGPEGITANAVAPGSTKTAILEASADVYGLSSSDEFARHHLDPRLLEPSEVAEAVVWLLSPSASGVTGALLPVDAGMTAR